MKILVIDVGGTHVKCFAPDQRKHAKFRSGAQMTPGEMVRRVLKRTSGWRFDVVSIGYPGVVRDGKPAAEPHNLAPGWVCFDFQASLAHPVRMINDAAMQALGSYVGGKMLFLGLGTGLGSALIVDGTIVPLELGHLQCGKGRDYEHDLGDQGRKRLGKKKWKARVSEVVEGFRKALLPDYIVLGGGNAGKLKQLPPHVRRGHNADAFRGGRRLWEGDNQDRSPSPPPRR